jgi:hypothetical protein
MGVKRSTSLWTTITGYDKKALRICPSTQKFPDSGRTFFSITRNNYGSYDCDLTEDERHQIIAALMDDELLHLAHLVINVLQGSLHEAATAKSVEDRVKAMQYLLDNVGEFSTVIKPYLDAFRANQEISERELRSLIDKTIA